MQVEPYLFFNGRCEEALNFYCQALGAKISFLTRYKDAPEGACQGPQMAPDKVMHANLQIGDCQLMASDAAGSTAFSGINLCLNADSPERAERLFDALAEGGQITMPLQRTFWAQAFGMLTDRFGVGWMINVEERPAQS